MSSPEGKVTPHLIIGDRAIISRCLFSERVAVVTERISNVEFSHCWVCVCIGGIFGRSLKENMV